MWVGVWVGRWGDPEGLGCGVHTYRCNFITHSLDKSAAALLLSLETRTSLIGIALMLRTKSVLPRLLLHATAISCADRLLLLLLQAAARLAGRGPAAAGRISMRTIMLPYMSGAKALGGVPTQCTAHSSQQQQCLPVGARNAETPGPFAHSQ